MANRNVTFGSGHPGVHHRCFPVWKDFIVQNVVLTCSVLQVAKHVLEGTHDNKKKIPRRGG